MRALSSSIRRDVFERARHRCEYCQTSRQVMGMPLVVDHIVPRSRSGSDQPENLCATCYRCNEFKGSRTHAEDPATGAIVPLFNPRAQSWHEHFAWANGGTHIVGLGPIGRATVIALRLNNEYVVESRLIWIARLWHPPPE